MNMKYFNFKITILVLFLIFGINIGYCKADFINIYSDDDVEISIFSGDLGQHEGSQLFAFRIIYLNENYRKAVVDATGLKIVPYIESQIVIFDNNWEQYRVLTLTFYDENNKVIDSVDMSDRFKWTDVKSKIETLKRDRAVLLTKLWEECGKIE